MLYPFCQLEFSIAPGIGSSIERVDLLEVLFGVQGVDDGSDFLFQFLAGLIGDENSFPIPLQSCERFLHLQVIVSEHREDVDHSAR